MENIKKQFDRIKLKKYECEKGERFFDPIRKLFVKMTPEEIVRQRMINFIINKMFVPVNRIYVEEHLSHYGVESFGRMDIVITYLNENYEEYVLTVIECKKEDVFITAGQVLEQAIDYAIAVNSKYFIVVNGREIQFYKRNEKMFFQPIEGILTYDDMIQDKNIVPLKETEFQRLDYKNYFDIETLKTNNWYFYKVGEDTPENLIPFLINLDDCLLDTSHRLSYIKSKNFSLIKDLGREYRQYGDASGGSFGTGVYRLFLVNDNRISKQFVIGFSIQATGKSVNDPKYGTVDGKSVLVVIYNDGDIDEMSVQINLNRFLIISSDKVAHIFHDGKVTRKGARKAELIKYITYYDRRLVKGSLIDLGTVDYSVPLTLKNADVIMMISKMIEYSVYRNEYKKEYSRRMLN